MVDEYDFEAKFYDEIWGRYDYDMDVKFLDKLFKKYRCRNVLDIGCGTGNHAIKLASLGYKVTATDVSDKMLEIARNKIHNRRINLMQADMRDIASIFPEGRFDGAYMLGHVAYHLKSDGEAGSILKGVHRVLKTGGVFVFNARNAKKIDESYLDNLLLDHLVNDQGVQIAVLGYNARDAEDANTIIWRPIFLVKENNKVDFQIREHRLHWFEFRRMKKLLLQADFRLMSTYSGPSEETFDEILHADMWFVTLSK
jgi:ubiquinone/menaquinone biosynthesis C-methylase UbiE